MDEKWRERAQPPGRRSAVCSWLEVWRCGAAACVGSYSIHCRRGCYVAHEPLRWLGLERGSQVNAGTETTPETEGETHELLQQLQELYSV